MNNAYPEYQSVNQKWAKEIPSHWRMERLKLVFGLRKETNNPVITDNILSLTAKQGVIPYAEKEGVGGNKPKADLTKYSSTSSVVKLFMIHILQKQILR